VPSSSTNRPVSDVIVVGGGHNALVCAAYLAEAGLSVTVLEGRDVIGGNTVTEELTLPGHLHDSCSSAHVLLQSNPVIRDDELGLAELGLREALGALLRLWGESHPDMAIETTISPSLGETGETSELTIYRVIQEALTNVFRHAGATSVNVSVEPAEQPTGLRADRSFARVRVCDNGSGMKPDHKLGFGLTGMRERILALGGTLSVASGDGGVTVEAMVPNDARVPVSRQQSPA